MKWQEARKQLLKDLPLHIKVYYHISLWFEFRLFELKDLLGKIKCLMGWHSWVTMLRMKDEPQFCLRCGRYNWWK